jgi:uncharacterized membrane protein YfcA
MTTLPLLFVAAAAGGVLNSVAGGGSFIVFPTLMFTGTPPIMANATTAAGLWPASVSSAVAYRKSIGADGKRRALPLVVASIVGGAAGAVLLLRTSDVTFVALLPFLLLFATLVFTFGRSISARLAQLKSAGRAAAVIATVAQLIVSTYGGYFGGGMGIMMLAIFTLLGMDDIHEMNGIKNVLGTLINGAAVIAFALAGLVEWRVAGTLAVGAVV